MRRVVGVWGPATMMMLGGSLAAAATDQVDPEPVVVFGDEAPIPEFGPGIFSGGSFGSDYGINDVGDIALNAAILWDDAPFIYYEFILNSGLFVVRDGVVSPVAVGGEPIPNGVEGEVFAIRDTRTLNNAGQFAFATAAIFPIDAFSFDGRDANLFIGDENGLTLLAKADRPELSPELPAGTTYAGFGLLADAQRDGDVRLNDRGDLAFAAVLAGDGVDASNDEVVVLRRDGVNEILLREGEAAPGLPPGVVFGCISCNQGASLTNPRLNELGDVVVRTRLAGTGVNALNDQAIYAFRDGVATLVARADEHAPGEDRFRFVREAETNERGDILFRSFFGPLPEPPQALFGGPIDAPVPVVREGEPAPELPGTSIGSLIEDSGSLNRLPIAQPILSGDGTSLFATNLTGPGIIPGGRNDRALYIGTADDLRLIIRTGEPTPGLAGFEFFSTGRFALNRDGIVVFEALIGPAGSFQSTLSLWSWTEASGLSLITRTGAELPLRDGATGVVEFLGFRGGPGRQGGFVSQLNEAGTLLFDANFPEGAGGIYRLELGRGSGCAADLDDDGAVGFSDLVLVLGAFGSSDAGDVDDDGDTDLADLLAVLAAFGGPCD